MKRSTWLAVLVILVLAASKSSQTPPPPPPKVMTALPATELPLADMSGFETPTINWQIVGSAMVPWDEKVEAFTTEKGTGILVNNPTEEAGGALRSKLEHADLELSFDFMMPKGSNSGVYLQGRYEIQLLDSWGKTEVGFGDCGGIYQRWDDTQAKGQEGFEGKAPILNASKAPGLWQQMKIRFQAPRFDDKGQKVANARVLSVVFNGKQIHRDVELTGPTRGSAFEQESAKGPLIIQGDHGPVAFRNMSYKLFGEDKASFQDLKYAYYEIESNKGAEDYIKDFDLSSLTPIAQSETDSISRHQAERRDNHILKYTGKLIVPEEGKYLFRIKVGGGCALFIDGEEVILADGEKAFNDPATFAEKSLTAGPHEFSFTYLQNHRFWRNGMGLWMEGPGIDFQALHAAGSVPPYRPPNPLWVETDERPKVMRGFVMFGDEKLTHTASIGSPQGVHFNYDLNQAKLLHVWRGPFLDVSPMWKGRGESQLAVPGGAAIAMSGKPSFVLAQKSPNAWPDSLDSSVKYLGYDLDAAGMPSFRYGIAGSEITDSYSVVGANLRRSIDGSSANKELQILLAESTEIEKVGEGLYALDGSSFYLKLIEGEAQLQQTSNGQRLIYNLSAPLKYELIW